MTAAHLVHGMGLALAAPAWPPIAPAEAAAALACFPGAGGLIGLRWHSPRPFSAATLLETDRGVFLLKRQHRRLRSRAALAEEHGFIAHLRARGIPAPEAMPAGDGTGAAAEGEWRYEMFRAAPGLDLYRDRASWTPFLTAGHARAAGAALARLHLAAHGYDAPARPPRPLVGSFAILPARDPLAAAAAYAAARPALAAFLADRPWREVLGGLFARFGHGLPALLADRPPLWTHNDWHPSNLLWTAAGAVRSVLDFGLATRTCALHDLATAIERSAIAWLHLPEDGGAAIGDAPAARALIAGYRAVAPLSDADIAALARLLPLVHIEFALSEIDYFAGVLGDPAQAALAWDGYLIDHAAWFGTAAGRDFLAALAAA